MAIRGLSAGWPSKADLPRDLVVERQLRLVKLLSPSHPVDVSRGGGDGAVRSDRVQSAHFTLQPSHLEY